MNRDIVLNGIHIGEHSFDVAGIIQEIRDRVIAQGLNFVTIRTRAASIPQEAFIEWAKFMAENKIYFCFLYTVQYPPKGRKSQFDKETVQKMREVAGEYFLGDILGETGSSGACKAAGYFRNVAGRGRDPVVIPEYTDMEAAHQNYVERVRKYIQINQNLGMPNTFSGEATALNKYNMEAGVNIPLLETMCGNPDILVSSVRGTARAWDSPMWGTYIAHEWYGGFRHADTLKQKRLELAYKYCYLAGSNILCLESGDEAIDSYGQVLKENSPVCIHYKKVLADMMDYIRKDNRPQNGPKVSVAFVSGLHDAWGGWGGTSIWNQFHKPEWGHGEAEHSWRLLDEIGIRRNWGDVANYGQEDLSGVPAYGMYDIVPIEADLEKLCRYDYLIFLGWNTMTEENMDKLISYVERGGRLLMSAAHLNCEVRRTDDIRLIDNKRIQKLFGACFVGDILRTNNGVKFRDISLNTELQYPGTPDGFADPICSGGYADYGVFELLDGSAVALQGDSFGYQPDGLPAVIENRLGKGIATLVTCVNYPGHPALLPLYRTVLRAMLTGSAASCPVQVLGGDRLRWACYEGNKLYLLNTDYDLPITVKVKIENVERQITLEPLELKSMEV